MDSFKGQVIELDENKVSHLARLYQLAFDVHHPQYQEELLDLKALGLSCFPFYFEKNNPPYNHSVPGAMDKLYARKTVANKLVEINHQLNQEGLELLIFDAYRPLEIQNYFYFEWVPKDLRSKFPDHSEEWIMQKTGQYWSRGAKTKEELLNRIPPHSTGAAIDLTVRFTDSKIPLEMGTMFDDVSERSHIDHYENHVDLGCYTDVEAKKNRRFLYHLMQSFDFNGHPYEWWHYSYGDQMWAHFKEQNPIYSYAGDLLK